MKRLFLLVTLAFFSQTIRSETAREHAQTWAQEVITLQPEEVELMVNMLHWGSETVRTDLLVRNYVSPFLTTAKTMCQNALAAKEQPYSNMNATKITVALLTVAKQYRVAHHTWEACQTYVEEKPQDNQFGILFEQFRKKMEQEILIFLKSQKDLIEEFVHTTDNLFLHGAEELLVGTRTSSGMLQEIEDDVTGMDLLEKLEACSRTAEFTWEQSFAGLDAAQRATKFHETVGTMVKTIFTIYQQELHSHCSTPWYVAFNEHGIIPKEERKELLPKIAAS